MGMDFSVSWCQLRLTEKQIASYLTADTSDLLAKHEKMLCILFGIEPESNGEIQRMENPAERLQMILAEYLAHNQSVGNQSKQGYEEVMEYVIRDTGLSAAQIEQLRKAVEAKMPAEDVLEMARNRKDVLEIRRCIEFYEMMEKEQEPQGESKEKQEGTQMSEELQSLVQIIELYGRGLGGLERLSAFQRKRAAKGVQIAQVKALQHRMKLHYASEGHNTMKLSDLEKMTGGRYTILNIPLRGKKS